jgi:hypothetical protein
MMEDLINFHILKELRDGFEDISSAGAESSVKIG